MERALMESEDVYLRSFEQLSHIKSVHDAEMTEERRAQNAWRNYTVTPKSDSMAHEDAATTHYEQSLKLLDNSALEQNARVSPHVRGNCQI